MSRTVKHLGFYITIFLGEYIFYHVVIMHLSGGSFTEKKLYFKKIAENTFNIYILNMQIGYLELLWSYFSKWLRFLLVIAGLPILFFSIYKSVYQTKVSRKGFATR